MLRGKKLPGFVSMQFLCFSLPRSRLVTEPVFSHLPPLWSLSVLQTLRAHHRQAPTYISISLPPVLTLAAPAYYPIHIPFLLPCSLATFIFFLSAHIYQLLWLSPVILYKRAVKELTEESEKRRKGLAWSLGTTEYRINPGHGL